MLKHASHMCEQLTVLIKCECEGQAAGNADGYNVKWRITLSELLVTVRYAFSHDLLNVEN